MSTEVVNLFTSSNNINYVKDELSKLIKDDNIKEAVLDSLTEAIFEFQSYAIIEDSGQRLRHSTNTSAEVSRLNKAFIEDRLSFAKNFNMYADSNEYYADQMFIDDSLKPGPYNSFNNFEVDSNKRIFRYQDKNNFNRSNIPIWQIANRGPINNNNDELRNSEISQVRKTSGEIKIDHLSTMPIECKMPKWIDM